MESPSFCSLRLYLSSSPSRSLLPLVPISSLSFSFSFSSFFSLPSVFFSLHQCSSLYTHCNRHHRTITAGLLTRASLTPLHHHHGLTALPPPHHHHCSFVKLQLIHSQAQFRAPNCNTQQASQLQISKSPTRASSSSSRRQLHNPAPYQQRQGPVKQQQLPPSPGDHLISSPEISSRSRTKSLNRNLSSQHWILCRVAIYWHPKAKAPRGSSLHTIAVLPTQLLHLQKPRNQRNRTERKRSGFCSGLKVQSEQTEPKILVSVRVRVQHFVRIRVRFPALICIVTMKLLLKLLIIRFSMMTRHQSMW